MNPECTTSEVELMKACRAPSGSTVTLPEGGIWLRGAGSGPKVMRSEERRVGKECRYGRSALDRKDSFEEAGGGLYEIVNDLHRDEESADVLVGVSYTQI